MYVVSRESRDGSKSQMAALAFGTLEYYIYGYPTISDNPALSLSVLVLYIYVFMKEKCDQRKRT